MASERQLSRAVKLGLTGCKAEQRRGTCLFSTELVMSDSAATRRQLKIKAGVVKRFVALHVLSIIQEILI